MSVLKELGLSAQKVSQRFANAQILVVGDVMLDRYWFGDANRISPEAPVPVTKIDRVEQRAGGAANVARNISCLGGQVSLISVTGDDEAADSLEKLMTEANVDSYLSRDKSIATTIKLRVLARNQQLIRLDFEDLPGHEVLASTYADFERLLPLHDVVLLSDYGKGGLTHVKKMIALARQQQKPVFIDPKGDNYTKYKGASLLTPNRSELKEVVGSWDNEEELVEKTQHLIQKLELSGVLLTRSEEGMSLFECNGTVLNQGTQAREVYDVSGAGDTVIASMALSVAAGFDRGQAMKIANAAAGVVVAKIGTAVCTQEELFTKLS